MNLDQIFEAFNSMKVLVVGDIMIDAYFWGKVERISPEAPVPIVSVTNKESRMGGAANVAINLKALGATPYIASVVGNDDAGRLFDSLLNKREMPTAGVVVSEARPTTIKTRVIGNNQQILRVDEETLDPISNDENTRLLAAITQIVENEKIDVIIFEDYDKGTITEPLIASVVALAKQHNIPTTVDPKKDHFLAYNNVSLFKPNLKELKEGLKTEESLLDESSVLRACKELQEKLGYDKGLITLSERGVLIHDESQHHQIPAHPRKILDVSGAGDTVISVASLALALGLSDELIAGLSNLAGGLVCEEVGVTPISKSRLLQEAKSVF